MSERICPECNGEGNVPRFFELRSLCGNYCDYKEVKVCCETCDGEGHVEE